MYVKMNIRVTQTHIDKGCRGSAYDCPVTRALNEVLIESVTASVGWGSVILSTYNHKFLEIDLPEIATQFSHDFDLDLKVKPFEFELGIPKQFLKEGV